MGLSLIAEVCLALSPQTTPNPPESFLHLSAFYSAFRSLQLVHYSWEEMGASFILRAVRLTRVVQGFKVARHGCLRGMTNVLNGVLRALSQSLDALILLVGLLAIGLLVFGSAVFLAEQVVLQCIAADSPPPPSCVACSCLFLDHH